MPYILLRNDVKLSQTEVGSIIVNKRTNKYYVLDSVGTEMLTLALIEDTEKNIIDHLSEKYDINSFTLSADFEELMQKLENSAIASRKENKGFLDFLRTLIRAFAR